MPEYLAPGVYVEEIEIGAKPIEGVSTSTAGFIGIAEKGPLNQPTLVTSFAEYQRVFGGHLDKELKTVGPDNKNIYMGFLPYAVEGFFANGGKRAYVTRVALKSEDEEETDPKFARSAKGNIPDASGGSAKLTDIVSGGSKTLKIDNKIDLLNSKDFLIDDDSQSESIKVIDYAKTLTLDSSLINDYDANLKIELANKGSESFELKSIESSNNKIEFKVDVSLKIGDGLLIEDTSDPSMNEICVVTGTPDPQNTKKIPVTLLKHTHSDLTNLSVFKLEIDPTKAANIISKVEKGSKILPISSKDTIFGQNNYIKISKEINPPVNPEYFNITGATTSSDNILWLETELKYSHANNKTIQQLISAIEVTAANEGKWGNRIKIRIEKSDIPKLNMTNTVLNSNLLELDTVTGIEEGTLLELPTTSPKYGVVKEVIKNNTQKKVALLDPITIQQAGEVSIVEFDLTVSFNGFDEVFKNLSLIKKHSRYIEKAITKDTSQLITVKDISNTPDSSRILLTTGKTKWELKNGQDGTPDSSTVQEVYKGHEDSNDPQKSTGIQSFKNVDDVSIISIPGITDQGLLNELIIHCEEMKDRFAVLDSEKGINLKGIKLQRNLYESKYAAIYYPWLRIYDTLSKTQINVPPSGYVCGIYARSDTERGVHKAPANEKLNGILGLEKIGEIERNITKGQQDTLNPNGINCIRSFPGRGIRIWGARTISSDSLWKYINIRRLFLFLEESIDEGTQWVVFEPNDEKLWARVRQTITQFLTQVWKDGALMGTTPEEAFFVKCDRSTMTQNDIDNGRLIVTIGVSPVKPAEFVIFRIAQWTGGSTT